MYASILKEELRWPKGSPMGGKFRSGNSPVPESIDHWTKKDKSQGGSNPGFQAYDETGQKYYVKFPKTADHVYNEVLASHLYKEAGVRVPDVKPITYHGRIGVASKWTSGMQNMGRSIRHVEGAKEGFAVDAWLSNWDTAGMGHDNMLMHPDGKAFRVDVGGSMQYRAQGQPKGDIFGDTVPEIDRMRDIHKSFNAAQVFGGMSEQEVANSVRKVAAVSDETIDKLVGTYYNASTEKRSILANKLIARKNYLISRYGRGA